MKANNEEITKVSPEDLRYYSGIISKNLFKIRSQVRLTQQQVASFLGLTSSGYGDYERHRAPESHVLYALAEFYGVSIAAFFVDMDTKGEVLNPERVKGAIENPMEGIAEGLKVIAGNVASDRVEELEKRVMALEVAIKQLTSG